MTQKKLSAENLSASSSGNHEQNVKKKLKPKLSLFQRSMLYTMFKYLDRSRYNCVSCVLIRGEICIFFSFKKKVVSKNVNVEICTLYVYQMFTRYGGL